MSNQQYFFTVQFMSTGLQYRLINVEGVQYRLMNFEGVQQFMASCMLWGGVDYTPLPNCYF